jgi:hypothetical protein
MRLTTFHLASTLALACAAPLYAQSTGLEDMVGARAGQAEGEIQRRGYRNVGGEKSDDRSYTYWWSDERRQCVTIATMDGRYASVTPSPAPDCRQPADRHGEEARNGGRDRSGRDGDDRRPHRSGEDHRRGSGYAAADELSYACRNAAAAEFDRRPSEITANYPIRQPYGFIVQGWFKDGERSRFFNCRFDQDGELVSVG